jgi:hypothetical protein
VKKKYQFVSSPIGYVQEKDLQGTFFALSQDSKIRYFSLMKLPMDMLMFVGVIQC